jgi:hypothetical protein
VMYIFPSGIWCVAKQWWHFPWKFACKVMNGPLFFLMEFSCLSNHGIHCMEFWLLSHDGISLIEFACWWRLMECWNLSWNVSTQRDKEQERRHAGESEASWNFHSSWRMMEWWNLP